MLLGMPWREITEEDLLSALTEPESSAYTMAAIGRGQDTFDDAMRMTVHKVRGYIADNQANVLAAGLTLPDRVIADALALMRWNVLTRLPVAISDERTTAYKDAIRFFERVADGKVRIERPEGVEVSKEDAGETVEVVHSVRQRASRRDLRGL